MDTIGIVVGMHAEARIAGVLGLAIAIGGGTSAGAAKAAQRLIDGGAAALLSFGIAGGLDPALSPGTLINPTEIHDGVVRWLTTPALIPWAPAPAGILAGSDAVLATAVAKQALRTQTGAAAIDMESHAVARIASHHGLPFAALRAIADPAGTTLPAASLGALNTDGTLNLRYLFRSLLHHPGQLPALLTLAVHAGRAQRALKSVIATHVKSAVPRP